MTSRAELIDEVYEKAKAKGSIEGLGLTKKLVSQVVELTFQQLGTGLVRSVDKSRITIAGFGTFSKTVRAARTARNPATGGTVEVGEKNVVKFKAAKALTA